MSEGLTFDKKGKLTSVLEFQKLESDDHGRN